MPNCYARLSDIKAEYQGSGAGTSLDAVLLRMGERASRLIDERTHRHFYSLPGQTLVFPQHPMPPHVGHSQLWLSADIASITSLKLDEDGDGVFEKTLAANVDYWTYHEDGGYNAKPHVPVARIDLNPRSVVATTFPRAPRSTQLVGTEGYSDEQALATELGAAIVSTTATSFTSKAAPDLSPGDTAVVDDEQMDVTGVSGTTITVTRGVNGTTAATHLIDAEVYRRRYPRPIELAASMQAVRFAREVQTGYGGNLANAELAGMSFRALYPAIRDALDPFIRYEVA